MEVSFSRIGPSILSLKATLSAALTVTIVKITNNKQQL